MKKKIYISGLKIDWHFCGGFALDVYLGRILGNLDCVRDFELVIKVLEEERYNWFIKAIKMAYPEGHPWIS